MIPDSEIDFIVKVLTDPTHTGDSDIRVSLAATDIRVRCGQLRQSRSQGQAAIQSKAEWLKDYLNQYISQK